MTAASFSGSFTDNPGSGRGVLQTMPGDSPKWAARDETVSVSGSLSDGQSLRLKEDNGTAALTFTFASGSLKRFVNTQADGSGGTEVESYTSPAAVTLTQQAEAVRYTA